MFTDGHNMPPFHTVMEAETFQLDQESFKRRLQVQRNQSVKPER
jgi:hypothetical protein